LRVNDKHLQETCLAGQLMIARFRGGGFHRKSAVFLSLAPSVAKMSFLLCTIFLKSVLINRSPQLFVLRIGAVSFSSDFGRREAWLLHAGRCAESMGRLTTHVLDAAHGCPGSSIKVELYRVEGSQLELVASAITNSDGRVDAPLLQGDEYRTGVYQVQFHAGDYYRARGVQLPEPAFLDVVVLRFGISAEQDHYHVPLLISPYSYSTYRGS
jgi:5-hydroxyisourate hydrolase